MTEATTQRTRTINRDAMIERLEEAKKKHLKVLQEARDEVRKNYVTFLSKEIELAQAKDWHPATAAYRDPSCLFGFFDSMFGVNQAENKVDLTMPKDHRTAFVCQIDILKNAESLENPPVGMEGKEFVEVTEDDYLVITELILLSDTQPEKTDGT